MANQNKKTNTDNSNNSKKQAGGKKNTKRGGALVNLDENGNAIANTNDLIQNTNAWKSVVDNDMVKAFKYLPAPFSTASTAQANYLEGIPSSTAESIMPTVGGGKKKPAAKKPVAKKPAAKKPANKKK